MVLCCCWYRVCGGARTDVAQRGLCCVFVFLLVVVLALPSPFFGRHQTQQPRKDTLPGILLQKVLGLNGLLRWMHEHTHAPPRVPKQPSTAGTNAPRLIPKEEEHQWLCYDSQTLEHTGEALQASVKLCVRTVGSILKLDGAEAWFAIPVRGVWFVLTLLLFVLLLVFLFCASCCVSMGLASRLQPSHPSLSDDLSLLLGCCCV